MVATTSATTIEVRTSRSMCALDSAVAQGGGAEARLLTDFGFAGTSGCSDNSQFAGRTATLRRAYDSDAEERQQNQTTRTWWIICEVQLALGME